MRKLLAAGLMALLSNSAVALEVANDQAAIIYWSQPLTTQLKPGQASYGFRFNSRQKILADFESQPFDFNQSAFPPTRPPMFDWQISKSQLKISGVNPFKLASSIRNLGESEENNTENIGNAALVALVVVGAAMASSGGSSDDEPNKPGTKTCRLRGSQVFLLLFMPFAGCPN